MSTWGAPAVGPNEVSLPGERGRKNEGRFKGLQGKRRGTMMNNVFFFPRCPMVSRFLKKTQVWEGCITSDCETVLMRDLTSETIYHPVTLCVKSLSTTRTFSTGPTKSIPDWELFTVHAAEPSATDCFPQRFCTQTELSFPINLILRHHHLIRIQVIGVSSNHSTILFRLGVLQGSA